MTGDLQIGLAITTIGRPALSGLLRSVADGAVWPLSVAVANQSGQPLRLPHGLPFPVTVIDSRGGASAGRNAAVAALPAHVTVLGFPNDDSEYLPDTLDAVARAWSVATCPVAVAGLLVDPSGPRFELPSAGASLTRRTIWRAIEPAMFVSRAAFVEVGGFDPTIGTGAGTPWGSGEGTDLLLRLLAHGHDVTSIPNIVVHGPGEQRDMTPMRLAQKHRAYARGTGYIYRRHAYPVRDRARILAGPWVKVLRHHPDPRVSLCLAVARFVGRIEGLRGVPFGDPNRAAWRPDAPRPEMK